MRTHELARELGISDKELFSFLRQQRLARNAMAPLSAIAIDAARTAFGKGDGAAVAVQTRGEKTVQLPPRLSVKDFAEKLGVSPAEVVRKLIALGTLATINQVI